MHRVFPIVVLECPNCIGRMRIVCAIASGGWAAVDHAIASIDRNTRHPMQVDVYLPVGYCAGIADSTLPSDVPNRAKLTSGSVELTWK